VSPKLSPDAVSVPSVVPYPGGYRRRRTGGAQAGGGRVGGWSRWLLPAQSQPPTSRSDTARCRGRRARRVQPQS